MRCVIPDLATVTLFIDKHGKVMFEYNRIPPNHLKEILLDEKVQCDIVDEVVNTVRWFQDRFDELERDVDRTYNVELD